MKMRAFEAELDRLKEQLRGLYAQMCEYAMSKYDETLEISIYGQLLDGEMERVQRGQSVSSVRSVISFAVDNFNNLEESHCEEECVREKYWKHCWCR